MALFTVKNLTNNEIVELPGLQGRPGSSILTLTEAPATLLGKTGDICLATIDGITYLYGPKTDLGWGDAVQVSVAGPAGPAGTADVWIGEEPPTGDETIWILPNGTPSPYGMIYQTTEAQYQLWLIAGTLNETDLYLTEAKAYLGEKEMAFVSTFESRISALEDAIL